MSRCTRIILIKLLFFISELVDAQLMDKPKLDI